MNAGVSIAVSGSWISLGKFINGFGDKMTTGMRSLVLELSIFMEIS